MHPNKLLKCFPGDAQAGGALVYALMFSSVIGMTAMVNASRGDTNKKIKEEESKHIFLKEINKTMRGQVNCPAGGITISPGSCPGSPNDSRVSPIKLSIELVRRLIIEEQSRRNLPRTTGKNARNAIVRQGIADYAYCRLDTVTGDFSASTPTLSSPACPNISTVKDKLNLSLTKQVKYFRSYVLPAINAKITSSSTPSSQKSFYQAMKEHVETRILNVDEVLVTNDRLARLGASPTAIEILISQGQGKLQEWLINPTSRTEDGKIPAYPLLLEPACLATPIPGTSPTEYLRRLTLKAEVDPRLSNDRQVQIKDLARFNLIKGSQTLMPIGLAPDCQIDEEDDDEDSKLGVGADDDEREDSWKNDTPRPKTKATTRRRIRNNRY